MRNRPTGGFWRGLSRPVKVAVAAVSILGVGAVLSATIGVNPSASSYRIDISSAVPRPQRLIVGVGTHFGIGGEYGYDPVKSAARIADLGLDSFRDDLGWQSATPAGVDGPVTIPVKLRDFMRLTSARPLLILNGGNGAVEGGKAPVTPAGRSAYARFAQAVARLPASQKPMLEIWNEWNLTADRQPKFIIGEGVSTDPRSAANYAPLAEQATAAIRRADIQIPVIIGATGVDPDWDWISGVYRRGGAREATGVSIHLYNHCERPADRTASRAIDHALAFHSKLMQAGGSATTPVYVTEFGWPTATGGGCAIDRQVSGDNIAQFLLWSAATPWVKGAWVYQLKDQGRDGHDVEHNFGLYDYDFAPKPAACMVRETLELIKSASAWRVDRPDRDVFLALARTSVGTRLVAWTSSASHRAKLTLSDGKQVSAHILCGATAAPANTIDVGPTPVVMDVSALNGTAIGLKML